MPDWNSRLRRRTFLTGSAAAASLATAGCLGGNQQQQTLDTPTTSTDTATAETLPRPVLGDPEADVTVIAFEDYACPHCREYAVNVAPEIISTYAEPGDIRYEFYDFPIPVDPTISWEAASAARAVQASEGQDAFFEYSKALFEAQDTLGPDTYERLANEAGFDGAAIRKAAVDRKYDSTVRADRQYGKRAGVSGTPTVAVDRQVVRPTTSAISTAIDEALA